MPRSVLREPSIAQMSHNASAPPPAGGLPGTLLRNLHCNSSGYERWSDTFPTYRGYTARYDEKSGPQTMVATVGVSV